jgi:hypothetical protein
MKILAIRDESQKKQKNLAYLLYYEAEKCFCIELPDDADPWETPLLLSSFAKRGEKTVNPHWSKLWVAQRIVPIDRQNLAQILKDNHLKEYDEYRLLLLSMGRCAQDDCYLIPMDANDLPREIQDRFQKRIENVIPLESYSLLVFFRDGKVKKISLREWFQSDKAFDVLLQNEELFYHVQTQVGGCGVSWDTNLSLSCTKLYETGQDIPLSAEDFANFAAHGVITSAEAAQLLGCSRQNIDDLTKRGKLHPIKSSSKTTLFLKSEVLKRNWL